MDEVDCGPVWAFPSQVTSSSWQYRERRLSPVRPRIEERIEPESLRVSHCDEKQPSDCLTVKPSELALLLKTGMEKYLVLDSRSFLEYNTCHIQQSANVCCSKLMKRRLQRDKVHIKDLLTQTCHIDVDEFINVIVYDQCTENPGNLTEDNFLYVLLQKLLRNFSTVALLKGGFLAFQAMYPTLCESKTTNYGCAALTALSQPCMPVSNVGPTRILPFLYLGSQQDALSQDIMRVNEITYVLNVSTTCIKPQNIQDGHFLRIPVNDNYSAKLQPYFKDAFQFLDKVREANGCVLVHCLAGISRSPTLAIAYIMKHLNMSSDEAYRYVKDKRPTISPNFNFLGQLLDFEKQMKREREGGNSDYPSGKVDPRQWSNYVMDLSSHSPSSPVSKNFKPFTFTISQGQSSTSNDVTGETGKKNERKSNDSETVVTETCVLRSEVKVSDCGFPCSTTEQNQQDTVSVHSPFPFSPESTVSRKAKSDLSRLAPYPKSSETPLLNSLTQISETLEAGSPSISVEEELTIPSSTSVARDGIDEVDACPFPHPGISLSSTSSFVTQSYRSSNYNHVEKTSGQFNTDNEVSAMETDQNVFTKPARLQMPTIRHSASRSDSDMHSLSLESGFMVMKKSRSCTFQGSQDSSLGMSSSPATSSDNALPFPFLLNRGQRPKRNSLSLSLSPITPTRPSSSSTDSGDKPFSFSSKEPPVFKSSIGGDRRGGGGASEMVGAKSRSCTNIPLHSGGSSVKTSHSVKLKSFSLSPCSSLSLSAQSPTTSLAKLHFDSPETETSVGVENHETNKSVLKKEKTFPFNSFPTTSLDKLNFTPCSSKTEDTSLRSTGVKRPLNSSSLEVKDGDPTSPMSVSSVMSTSSCSSYASNSSVTSPSGSGTTKVVVRKRENRIKRPHVRPNSIAFSSYPTFDLGSDCQDSPSSSSSTASQDDSSESYMLQNGKKSKPSEYMSDMKYRLGRYSEREVYRQITAAVETAMLKTQAFEASRKSRSLDDILNSEEDSSSTNCECSTFDRVLRHCALSRDRYHSPALVFENLACRYSDPVDRYESSSSLSSGGSPTSLQGSLEIIGVS